MSSSISDPTVFDIDRALVRELARMGNLLRQLRDDVQGGALRGEPQDGLDVLRALRRIEQRLESLLELRVES